MSNPFDVFDTASLQRQPQQPQQQANPFDQFDEEPTGNLSALAQGAGQGVTFGFSDEIEGGARAAYDAVTTGQSFNDAYDARLQAARDRLRRARESNPVAFYSGEIGSALLVPGGAARLGVTTAARAARAGLMARTAAGAASGAAYGGIYGFGTGEGENRLSNAANGAQYGAMFGAALPVAADVVGASVRRVTNPVRGYTNPKAVAGEKMSEALARDLGGAGEDLNRTAARLQSRSAAAAGSPTMTLADLGGEQTRGLMRQAVNMPNDRAGTFLRNLDVRAGNQWKRVKDNIGVALKNPDDFASARDVIISDRSQAAKGLFDRAFRNGADVMPVLSKYADRPTMQKVMQRVQTNLADDGKSLANISSTEYLHRIKMELDDIIGAMKSARDGGTMAAAGWNLRTLTALKSDLMSQVRKVNPAYGEALDNFAGHSAVKNAIDEGFEKFFKMRPEDIGNELSKLTKSERNAWELGATRAIADKLMRQPAINDRIKGIFTTPDMQARLRAIIPDNNARRQFQKSLAQEARQTALRQRVQGGSMTDRNLIQAQDTGVPVRGMNVAAQAAMGRLQPAIELAGNAYNRMSGLTPQVASEMLRLGSIPASRAAEAGLPHSLKTAISRASEQPVKRMKNADALIAALAAYNTGE